MLELWLCGASISYFILLRRWMADADTIGAVAVCVYVLPVLCALLWPCFVYSELFDKEPV